MFYRPIITGVLLIALGPGLFSQVVDAPHPAAGTALANEISGGGNTYTVPAGTKLLLSLKHEISTRSAQPGDTVYLVSVFPVVSSGVVVIPAGMYVKGVIDKVQRPGKVKGRAQLQMHFATMIFPNGVELAIPGTPDEIPGSNGAKVKNDEGTIEQGGTKGKDAQRVADNTMQGTGVGALVGWGAGSPGMGAGIGAGAGAAAGVITTLFTRGSEIVFPEGTTLEMTLSRALYVKSAQLQGMPAYTGTNGPPQPSGVR